MIFQFKHSEQPGYRCVEMSVHNPRSQTQCLRTPERSYVKSLAPATIAFANRRSRYATKGRTSPGFYPEVFRWDLRRSVSNNVSHKA